MKSDIIFLLFYIPLFLNFHCSGDTELNCSRVAYERSDLAGFYSADFIETEIRCDPGYQLISRNRDDLDYTLELNEDGTGRVTGPDTLTEFEWIVNSIESWTGKGSGGCYDEFKIWTATTRIEYQLFSVNEYGLELYRNDSSWNYGGCNREVICNFKREN